MGKGSSRRWRREQDSDPYVREAQRLGYRSRAAFKLIEINRRESLLARGDAVVDLGAAPGGWSQVAAGLVGPQGLVLALDILQMDALADVQVVQADFTSDEALLRVDELVGDRRLDVVLSDMAPNLTGVKAADQASATYLAELALEFARARLRQGGSLLVKTFHGEGFDGFRRDMMTSFDRLAVRKPAASRPKSAETYLLGTGYHM